MMKLILFAALAITAHCAPISLSPEEMELVSTNIHSAKDNLDQMVSTEETEIKKIREVKTVIEGVKDDKSLTVETVLKAAQVAGADEQQVASDEQSQQNNAMQALKQVENVEPVLQKFGTAGGPLQKANEKIAQVTDTLSRGAKTMNNQHLVNNMAEESTKLIKQLNPNPNMLGETGVLTNLNAVEQNPQQGPEPKAAPQEDGFPQGIPHEEGQTPPKAEQPAEGGVLSLLKTVPQQKDTLTQAEDDLKALQAQIPEEHAVVEAEKRAETEIKGMINNLN